MRRILETIFHYRGFWGAEAKCHLRAYESPGATLVVLATELDDNPGTSVTNMAERLATRVRAALERTDVRLLWIEHYPARGTGRLLEERFSEVTFSETLRGFVRPRWRHMAPEEVEALVGEPVDDLPGEDSVRALAEPRRFDLGKIALTPGAERVLRREGADPLPYLLRHARGDGGDLGSEDRAVNREALRKRRGRVLSVFVLPATGERLWITTDLQASETTILLPREY